MNTFPVCPTSVPPRIGRERIYRRMCDELTKPTPQSLSLVGPRYFGKSVMLSALVNSSSLQAEYACIVPWDLGHQIPKDDEDFLRLMAGKIGAALKGINNDVSKHLSTENVDYDRLVEAIELLEIEGSRILMIWDCVDPTITSGNFTRNLWDNLLALARRDSLVLVTGSRKKLQQLIRDAQSVTSEFWLLFDPVRLEPMDHDDIQAFANTLPGIAFETGALKELFNWSGGIPPAIGWLLNRTLDGHTGGSISVKDIQEAAEEIDDRFSGILQTLWEDCPADVTDLYRSLVESGGLNFAELPKIGRQVLLDYGLAQQEKNKLFPACRLMQQQVCGSNSEYGALARMFGNWEAYQQNIRGILERRLAQIARFDERFVHLIEISIQELPNNPDLCLSNLSNIEEHAFGLMWQKEFERENRVPQDWVNHWTTNPGALPKQIKGMMEQDKWEIPQDRPTQLAILQLITGSHHTFTQSVARFVTKDAYVLLNAIHTFRNRSEHAGGQTIGLGVAVAALLLCVELLGCLAEKKPTKI